MCNNWIEYLIDVFYVINDCVFYIYFDEVMDGYIVENNWCLFECFDFNCLGFYNVWKKNGL